MADSGRPRRVSPRVHPRRYTGDEGWAPPRLTASVRSWFVGQLNSPFGIDYSSQFGPRHRTGLLDTSTYQPSVLNAMWRHRWLVLVSVVVVTAVGYLYGASRPAQYVSTASMVVEDPSGEGVFETSSGNPERYVADQMAMLESAVVAERAAGLAAVQLPSADITPNDVLDNVDVLGSSQSSIIELSFRASNPEVAQVVTNALVAAYEEVRRSEAANSSAAALERLDASLQAMEEELTSIRAEIATAQGGTPFQVELGQQMENAVTRLLSLWDQRAATSDLDALALIEAELDGVTSQLQTLGLIQSLRQQDPQQSALLEEQNTVLARRDQLQTRRDQMIVDAELAPNGIFVLSPATAGEASGPGIQSILAVAVILGILAGAGLAYIRAQRKRTFRERSEPELVLNAPLLAEVPVFAEEGIKSSMPIQTNRVSVAAEAFRFAAAAIEIQGTEARSLIAVSSALGDGKTTIVANTGIAAAQQGARVLLVDADFGDQSLSRLLLDGMEPDRGLTEMVEMGLEPKDVIRVIPLADGVSLRLIGRGRLPVTAPDVFRSAGAQNFFARAREQFDLVLIDAPPLLQVAYASSIARYAGAALVVVPHETEIGDVENLSARLAFIGIPIAGYIYNYAPLRPEMVASTRSLSNPSGTPSASESTDQRGARHQA